MERKNLENTLAALISELKPSPFTPEKAAEHWSVELDGTEETNSRWPRLILLLDSLMDLEPEPPPVRALSPDIRPSLELEILFRQNYSWQGRLRWLEGGQEAVFRSVLELMILIETIFA